MVTTWTGLLGAVALAATSACGGGGNECAACFDEKCSDLLPFCDAEPGCPCMVECTGENGIPGVVSCLDVCGLTERPAAFIPLEACVAVACPDEEDECATPADWVPPGDDLTCEGSTAGIGGGALADCSFDTGLQFDPDGAVLQLESGDGNLCVRIERRDDGAGTLANTSWTLLDVFVGPLGEVAHVENDHCWYSSHHNFRDWAHVWTGTRHFDLVLKEDGHGGARTYELYVFEQGPLDSSCSPTADGSMCIDGPIELFPLNP